MASWIRAVAPEVIRGQFLVTFADGLDVGMSKR